MVMVLISTAHSSNSYVTKYMETSLTYQNYMTKQRKHPTAKIAPKSPRAHATEQLENLANAKVSERQPWYTGHNSLNHPSLRNA